MAGRVPFQTNYSLQLIRGDEIFVAKFIKED
jgi:hypothetical protein